MGGSKLWFRMETIARYCDYIKEWRDDNDDILPDSARERTKKKTVGARALIQIGKCKPEPAIIAYYDNWMIIYGWRCLGPARVF
jgi:hypothetical protein